MDQRFVEHFERAGNVPALVHRDKVFTFADLASAIAAAEAVLSESRIGAGSVVVLEADYSLDGIAFLLALIARRSIAVPLTAPDAARRAAVVEISRAEFLIRCAEGPAKVEKAGGAPQKAPLLDGLRRGGRPGIVLFTSGTTGAPKGVVHDAAALLIKFDRPGHARRTVAFMVFDHIGGLDTLFYTLLHGGCLLIPPARSPDAVAELVQRHKAEVLPASPTFLNLLLLGESHKRFDLSSLEAITYGAEPMPEHVLKRLHSLFPKVKMLQKYGLSELGAVRIKSRSSDSLWVKIGGEGLQARVRDGMLELKAGTAMLGYLNAPSPFTADGWFKTGDAVVQEGDYYRILGRATDVINVGGEKVYPAEIEDVLLSMDGVSHAVVSGEKNALSGELVKAAVSLRTDEALPDFRVRMRRYFQDRGLPSYKVPQKVVLQDEPEAGARKSRRNA